MRAERPFLWLALAACLIGALPAWAQTSGRRLPTHGDWQSFVVGEGASRQCVAISFPEEIQPESLNRGDIAILVSHQLDRGDFDIVQIKMGYPLAEESKIRVDVDGEKWELFADNQNAWPWDLEANAAILSAMRSGLEMYVEGRSQRGNATMDRYSLRGISSALREINAACGR